MEIQGRPSGPEPKQTYEQRRRALIDANRAIVRAALEDMSAVAKERQPVRTSDASPAAAQGKTLHKDEIQISAATQRAVREPSSAEREARVRKLTEAHRIHQLHTPERIERAAQRLLES